MALNKYGDIPNLGTQAKRARRRKNRELRESDPGKYKGVMEQKKKRRDRFMREITTRTDSQSQRVVGDAGCGSIAKVQ